jgi:DNA-directed RNA polymerase specialized sigma24 family protein
MADDLVSITIGKLFRHWRRVRVMEHVDAYVRGMLTNAWLDERRRPWRREKVTDNLPDRAEVSVPGSAARGLETLRALAEVDAAAKEEGA